MRNAAAPSEKFPSLYARACRPIRSLGGGALNAMTTNVSMICDQAMKKAFAAILCFCVSGAQAMEAAPWVTFKTGTVPGYGRVQHQIDRTSIKQEGPYKTFTTRLWLIAERQPLTFSRYEQILFEWQKYAVDCGQGQFGSRIIDSNNPKARKTSLDAMRWIKLDKVPAVASTVCGKK